MIHEFLLPCEASSLIYNNVNKFKHQKEPARIKKSSTDKETPKIDNSRRNSDALFLELRQSRIVFNILQSYFISEMKEFAVTEPVYNVSSMQYAYYAEGGFFKRHHDVLVDERGVFRIYTAVLQLTDAHKYEGCDLIVYPPNNDPKHASRQRGNVIIFPSFYDHEVTPLVKGERESLVCWLMGSSKDMSRTRSAYKPS